MFEKYGVPLMKTKSFFDPKTNTLSIVHLNEDGTVMQPESFEVLLAKAKEIVAKVGPEVEELSRLVLDGVFVHSLDSIKHLLKQRTAYYDMWTRQVESFEKAIADGLEQIKYPEYLEE